MLRVIGTAAAAFLLLGVVTWSSGLSAADDEELRLVLLGTGNPNPEPDRSGPSIAVIANGTAYIVDAGPGLVRRAAAASRKYGLESLEAQNLRIAFLTHLHSDHTVGLADLILTPWVMEREGPLRLFGPPGTKHMARRILAAYRADIENRRDGLQPATQDGWRVEASEVDEGFVLADGNIKIEAFRVCHGGWEVALGYRFSSPQRVIVVSGDTTYCPNLVKWARGADILLHEVYSARAFEALPEEWQKYHRISHTSAPDLARIAAEAKPGLLVLYHQLYWAGASDEEILAEIAENYKGAVIAGRDLDIF